jgi:hypothetical protein
MKLFLKLSGVALLGLTLSGCFNGSDSDTKKIPDSVTQTTDFTDFVTSEIRNTANDRDAVAINDRELNFNDQNNEQAFDELF